MDFPNESIQLLEQFDVPAFLADNTAVIISNTKAKALGIGEGTELSTIFEGITLEQNSQLSFSAKLQGVQYCVNATPIANATLYKLVVNDLTLQLQSITRAAQQLRVPLSGLASSINLLKQDQDDILFNKTTKHLMALQRAVRNMSDAALFLEDRTSKKEMVEITGYFSEIMEKVQQHFSDTDVTITYCVFEQKLHCNADITLLERAIYNMISNSLKAGSKSLQLDLKKVSKNLLLTVTDNGCGMSDEQKAAILSHFREQPNWNAQSYGLGLGMMIVYAAAKAHNGTLLISDVQPHGCKITLSMAIEKSDAVFRQKPVGIHVDPLGGADPLLLELADVLPAKDYI